MRLELQAAARWQTPWRRFNGHEPAEVTTHEYDPDGRLVRSVTRPEPEWGDEDRAWALALLQYENSLCGGCGHPLAETTDPTRQDRYKPDGYVQCFRCVALEMACDAHDPKEHPRHRTYRYEIKTLPPAVQRQRRRPGK